MKRSPNLWRVSQIVEPDSERAKKESESKSGEKAEEKTEEQDEKEKMNDPFTWDMMRKARIRSRKLQPQR